MNPISIMNNLKIELDCEDIYVLLGCVMFIRIHYDD